MTWDPQVVPKPTPSRAAPCASGVGGVLSASLHPPHPKAPAESGAGLCGHSEEMGNHHVGMKTDRFTVHVRY